MASIQFDPVSRQFRVRFRFGGKAYFRSLKTASEKEAEARHGAVKHTIFAVEQGYLTIPAGVDPGDFLLADGRIVAPLVIDLSQPSPSEQVAPTLKILFDAYERELTVGAKEANTRDTEKVHRRHLEGHFGVAAALAEIDHKAVQGYVNARSEKGMAVKTLRLELGTLRMVWNWGVSNGHASALPWEMKRLVFPKGTSREPFQTWEQIERKVEALRRGKKLTPEREARLWECLYLDEVKIKACLEHVREHAAYSFVHPMFAFCAYTGARRSEILRSEREDWDFAAGTVAIRQKKADTSRTFTLRQVPIHPALAEIVRAWFLKHPGGPFTICTANQAQIGPRMATKYFTAALRGSKWAVVPGFHAFRHSLASIMASRGVDQRIINEVLGHSTEDMVKRYRHLFPAKQEQAISQLF